MANHTWWFSSFSSVNEYIVSSGELDDRHSLEGFSLYACAEELLATFFSHIHEAKKSRLNATEPFSEPFDIHKLVSTNH